MHEYWRKYRKQHIELLILLYDDLNNNNQGIRWTDIGENGDPRNINRLIKEELVIKTSNQDDGVYNLNPEKLNNIKEIIHDYYTKDLVPHYDKVTNHLNGYESHYRDVGLLLLSILILFSFTIFLYDKDITGRAAESIQPPCYYINGLCTLNK